MFILRPSPLLHTPSLAAQHRQGASGFTLIELLIVLVVGAILASVAAPSLSGLVASQRAKSAATNLHLALTLARSEATRRNANITVAANPGGWVKGWKVYRTTEPTTILQNYPATKGISISATIPGGSTVEYQSSGRIRGTGAVTFVITVADHDAAARCISVDLSGRPYVKAGTSC